MVQDGRLAAGIILGRRFRIAEAPAFALQCRFPHGMFEQSTKTDRSVRGTNEMATLQLIGFGSTGWGALLLLGALMTLCVTAVALAIGAVLGAIVAAAKLSGNLILKHAWKRLYDCFPQACRSCSSSISSISADRARSPASASRLAMKAFWGCHPSRPVRLRSASSPALIRPKCSAALYLCDLKGELEAASAIGMHGALRFRRIIMPQVLRFALPGMGNVWQLSLKDSALISVTGLAELMRTSQVAAGSDPAILPVLHRRWRALSHPDEPVGPRLQHGRAACQSQHAPAQWAGPEDRSLDFAFLGQTMLTLLEALPTTLALFFLSIAIGGLLAILDRLDAGGRQSGPRPPSPRATSSSSAARRC